MKWFMGLVAVFLAFAVGVGLCQGQTIPGGRYFGQNPPGMVPEIFAPGIISLTGRYEYCLVFSPSLDECIFGVTNNTWGVFSLWYTKMGSDSTWIDPIPAPPQGNGDGLFPCYSGDGNQVCFASSRPGSSGTDVWRSTREGSTWSTPVLLDAPVNSAYNEWGGSLTDDGTFYFSSTRPGGTGAADIYRTVTSPGGVVTVENLGSTVNSPQLEGSSYIARDGSYLIFESQRTGGYGHSDLYISYSHGGVWTTPRNLGPAINTSYFEDGCFMSPDEKYLFFNRRLAYSTSEQTEIWWVDAQAVLDPAESDVTNPGGHSAVPSLLRNAPNPFSSSTTITYSTPASGYAVVKIYDVLGREVQSLVNRTVEAGTHSVRFDAPPGEGPADGVYYYSLQTGDRTLKTTRMVRLR